MCIIRIYLLLFLISPVFCYYPVLCMHGVTSGASSCDTIKGVVTREHPNTTFVELKFYQNALSLVGLQTQLEKMVPFVQKIVQSDPVFDNGWIMVCHSQGALLCRCLSQYWTGHKIHTLVAMAGPHAGVYGKEFLTDNVPFTKHFPNLDKLIEENIYQIFDSPLFDKYLSVADMWHDPYHSSDFLKRNHFLPKMNNLINHPDSEQFKKNFLSLQQAVFYVGDVGVKDLYDDGIAPWQSGVWGYWDENRTMLNMTETRIWKEDLIGLRKLSEANRFYAESVKGVRHNDWLNKEDIIKKYILQWLV